MDIQVRYTTDLDKPSRDDILKLEEAIWQLPRVETPIAHHFSDGVYCREMFIPAGTVLTGKIHLTRHLSILLEGEISVMTENGIKRLRGPLVLESVAGMKRAGFAHTDTRWMTVHPTRETDLEKLEAQLVTDTFDDPRLAAPVLSLEVLS